jgi:hypothetical protein
VATGEWLAELMSRPFVPPGARLVPRPPEVSLTRDEWIAQHGGPALPLSRGDTILFCQDGASTGHDGWRTWFKPPPDHPQDLAHVRFRYAKRLLKMTEEAMTYWRGSAS